MTTAHKPTYHPAVGSANQGGYRYRTARLQFSSKDMPGQTKLKYRQVGQNSVEEMMERDLQAELEQRESLLAEEVAHEKKRQGFIEAPVSDVPPLPIEAPKPQIDDYDDADDSDSSSNSGSSSDDDDEDDDEAELLAELERIKAEREAERLRKEIEFQEDEKAQSDSTILRGNPLLQEGLGVGGGFTVKRRWDDDVVFKNQAADAPLVKKRFINDTIRNDFHVRFLHRYIQ